MCFDFFEFFDFEKNFYRQTDRPTDRPTDRQTFGLIEATSRRLKIQLKLDEETLKIRKLQVTGRLGDIITSFLFVQMLRRTRQDFI